MGAPIPSSGPPLPLSSLAIASASPIPAADPPNVLVLPAGDPNSIGYSVEYGPPPWPHPPIIDRTVNGCADNGLPDLCMYWVPKYMYSSGLIAYELILKDPLCYGSGPQNQDGSGGTCSGDLAAQQCASGDPNPCGIFWTGPNTFSSWLPCNTTSGPGCYEIDDNGAQVLVPCPWILKTCEDFDAADPFQQPCSPGQIYNPQTESCVDPPIPFVIFIQPVPGPSLCSLAVSDCPRGTFLDQARCVCVTDPPLPLASDGIGFSKPSNVALPVHPTISAERIREVCGVCGSVDDSEEELPNGN